MKHVFFLILMILVFAGTVNSQSPVVVYSQNKCHWDRLSDLNKEMEDHGAPILNQLVSEGKLLNWGVLQHAWGDEWNWNIYYTAPDIPTFLEAFNTYIARYAESRPEALDAFWEMCYEHKDAMYGEPVGFNSTAGGYGVKSMTMFTMPEGVEESALKASIEQINTAIAKLGFPGSGYALYNVRDEEVKRYQYLLEGTWPSQEVYDIIHKSDAWKDATARDSAMWDKVMADRTYRRYYRK